MARKKQEIMSQEDQLVNLEGEDMGQDTPETSPEDFTMLLENQDGSVDVNMSENDLKDLLEDEKEDSNKDDFYDNLVNKLDEETLKKIGSDVVDAADSDEQTRADWMNTITKGLDILGVGIDEVSEPFEGACAASHPLILEAAIKFQSKASAELLPADGPVKTQILGNATRELEEQSMRVKEFMNYQVTTQMTEYYPDKERMLFYLPLIGSAFTKTYWCETEGRVVSEFIPVDQFIISYNTTDLERARRYTHVIFKTKDDLKKDISEGLYSDVLEEIGEPSQIELSDFQQKQGSIIGLVPGENDFDSVYTLLEQHVNLYLKTDKDEYEITKPYIVTVDKASNTVLGVRRNWKPEDEKFRKKVIFTHYTFVPGLGFYGLGYIHLLGNLQMTLTSALRALIDAGQFANLPAGFKTKNIRMPKDAGPLKPGEWRDIETSGQKLAEALFPAPYKEPSATLFEMLKFLEARSGQFADSTEQVVADSTNYGPVGTTMALLDASTKFFTAAHRRLHFSQKKELSIIAKINGEYLDEELEYNIPGSTMQISASDFSSRIDVLPVSDPNISSNAHRITLETTKTQMVQQLGAQSSVNMKEMLRRQFLALGEKDIDKIIPPDEEAKPQDPVSDILAVIQGKPIKSFPGQNHDAHMQVKAGWLEDPSNGGTPIMANVGPILQANIREHMVMKYQEQIAGAMQNLQQAQPTGAATDQKTMEMVIAEAAKMVAENNKAAQQIAGQGTPEAQIAKAELIKAENDVKELDHKKKKDFAMAALQAEKINLDTIKEANRHTEAKQNLLAGLTKERMKQGKDLALASVKNLSDGEKFQSTQNQKKSSSEQDN